MSKPHIFQTTIPHELESLAEVTTNAELPRDAAENGQSIKHFGGKIRQLQWGDRLNLVLATILGAALVVALSPILLVLWACQKLAKGGIGCRPPDSSKIKPYA